MQKDPSKKRDRPEPQRLARDAADPERATLAELRRQHGRDLAAWPPEDRERYERWEATQLAAKAERARRDRTVTVAVGHTMADFERGLDEVTDG